MRAINAGLPYLLEVRRLLVATDNDEEGERAAAYLLERHYCATGAQGERGG